MDLYTTLDNLKPIVKSFCEARDWDQFHSAKDLAIGISTEANELLDLFRFKTDAEINTKLSDPLFRKKVENELSDVFFFLIRFAQKYKIDLTTAFTAKMALNAQKYPVEKFKGSNRKHNE